MVSLIWKKLEEGALVELLHAHRTSVALAAAEAEQVAEAAAEVTIIHRVNDRVQHRVRVTFKIEFGKIVEIT